ncbi:MAG TPA: DUF2726 domain-containing protein [Anaerolineales bacterium]
MPDRNSLTIKEHRQPRERLPYRLRQPFLSAPELALLRALQKMLGSLYLICPKVALNDVFYVVRPNENVHFFNKFFRKHVDFLLCELETLKPAIGIELVSRASKTEAREADQFMSDLFLSAGLPLVRVLSGETYSEQELTALFQQAVKRVKETGPLRATAKTDSVPMCPICGRMMVLRIRRDGQRSGEKYYGCPDNPHCPGEVDVK